jgi:hypothetical protein
MAGSCARVVVVGAWWLCFNHPIFPDQQRHRNGGPTLAGVEGRHPPLEANCAKKLPRHCSSYCVQGKWLCGSMSHRDGGPQIIGWLIGPPSALGAKWPKAPSACRSYSALLSFGIAVPWPVPDAWSRRPLRRQRVVPLSRSGLLGFGTHTQPSNR